MAVTQAEYKKMTTDPVILAVLQIYLNVAPFLNFLGFEGIKGGSISFNREKTLPDAGFRVINSPFITSSGEIEKITEDLTISGGKITVDRALLQMYGNSRLAADQVMQIKALGYALNLAFYKGDGTGGSFSGLQTRATHIVDNGTAALSLTNLDRAIVRCQGSNKVMWVNEQMYLRINSASKSSDLGAQITIAQDQFGVPITYYAGIPVVMAGEDGSGAQVLPFTEAASTTSIYITAFDDDGVQGVQNGNIINYEPVKESHANEYDIEWLMSFLIGNPKSVQRISGITDLKVVE